MELNEKIIVPVVGLVIIAAWVYSAANDVALEQ